jgi:hypothetical protein
MDVYSVDYVTKYNEEKRLRERERVFDVSAPQRLAATAVDSRPRNSQSFVYRID